MRVVYRAFDGAEFDNEGLCAAHEHGLKSQALAHQFAVPGRAGGDSGIYSHCRNDLGKFILSFQDGSYLEFDEERIVGYNKGRTAVVLHYSRDTSQEGGNDGL